MSRYVATYSVTAATPPEWADWLVHVQAADSTPCDLADATDVCASARCVASLWTESGGFAGTIDADGTPHLRRARPRRRSRPS